MMTAPDAELTLAEPALRPSASPDAGATDVATPKGCPFLLADSGGWRLDLPSRDHRCAAFSPSAPLAPEKQTRLCLTDTHTMCATYIASLAAREARLGLPTSDRATRWGLARTTTVIEDPGGMRGRLLTLLLDRRRWPAIPAVLLIAALFTLALSGFRAEIPATPVATASPGAPASSARPSPATVATREPTEAPSASAPATSGEPASPQPSSVAATSGPAASFRNYTVQAGDTLSAIAARFGTSIRSIVDLNNLSSPDQLSVGQVLLIP